MEAFWELILWIIFLFIFDALDKTEVEIIEVVKRLYNKFRPEVEYYHKLLQFKKDLLQMFSPRKL